MRSLGDIAKIQTFSRFENSVKDKFACNLLILRAKSLKMYENNIHRMFELFFAVITYLNSCPLRVRFSEMHEKYPKRFDTIESRLETPHFYFDFSSRIQLSFHENHMRVSISNVSLLDDKGNADRYCNI